MNKAESRYFNTAARMDEALLELLEQKSFEYITIKEICEKAGVNRSTFYLHYENTRDLLEEALGYMSRKFHAYFKDIEQGIFSRLETCKVDELILVTPEYLHPYLSFINENRRLFMAAIRQSASMNLNAAYQQMFQHIFEPILKRFNFSEGERKYAMTFYIEGIIAVICEWIKNGCKESVSEMTDIIIKCTSAETIAIYKKQ